VTWEVSSHRREGRHRNAGRRCVQKVKTGRYEKLTLYGSPKSTLASESQGKTAARDRQRTAVPRHSKGKEYRPGKMFALTREEGSGRSRTKASERKRTKGEDASRGQEEKKDLSPTGQQKKRGGISSERSVRS